MLDEKALQQRKDALAKANAIRVNRARMKKQMRAGEIDPIPLLQSPPPCMRSMSITEFLTCIPAVGASKAKEFRRRADLRSPTAPLEKLSDRVIEALVGELQKWGSKRGHGAKVGTGQLRQDLVAA